jgi:hypothetical protein
MKDHEYRQRVNTLDELKARITVAIADVTMDMLQRVCQETAYTWGAYRVTDTAHSEVFRT